MSLVDVPVLDITARGPHKFTKIGGCFSCLKLGQLCQSKDLFSLGFKRDIFGPAGLHRRLSGIFNVKDMPVQMQTFLKGGPMPLSLDALIESPTSLGSFYAIPRHRVPLDSDHLCTSSLASSQGQQNFFAIPTPVTTRLDGEGPLSYAAFDGYGDTYTILSHEPEPVELFSIPPPSSSNVTPFPAMMTFPDDGFADCSVLPKDTDVFLEPCLSDYQCSWAGQELATLKAFPIPFHDSTFCRQEAQPIVCLPTSDEIDGTYGAEEADCWDYSQASSSEVPSPMYEQFGRVACPPETAPGVVLESTLVQSQESPSKALVLTADEYSTFKATECLPLGETAAAKKLPPKSSSRRRKGPILCPVCNKQFCRPCNLKDHMYELEGQHECPTCGRRFQQKYNLSNHEKIHAGPFACTECLQKFKTRAILRSHLRSHNPDPVMKQCPEKDCNKQYKRGGCLNRHIKTVGS